MIKKVVAALVLGFAAFYLLTAPAGAADAVSSAADAVMDGFEQVNIFVNELAA